MNANEGRDLKLTRPIKCPTQARKICLQRCSRPFTVLARGKYLAAIDRNCDTTSSLCCKRKRRAAAQAFRMTCSSGSLTNLEEHSVTRAFRWADQGLRNMMTERPSMSGANGTQLRPMECDRIHTCRNDLGLSVQIRGLMFQSGKPLLSFSKAGM